MQTSNETARGRVLWFGELKGYGFIRSDRGGGDVFVHRSAIVGWNRTGKESRPVLRKGERVEFEIKVVQGRDSKPAARNVRVLSE